MNTLKLHFKGPYSFYDKEQSIFHCQYARQAGIYLWTLKVDSHSSYTILYIGETRNLAKRQYEHLFNILGLNYRIINPNAALQGELEILWPGLWRDKSFNSIADAIDLYSILSLEVTAYVKLIKIFFTPLEIADDIRKHIEGSIAWNLRKNYPEYKKFYPDDNRTGRKANTIGVKLEIITDEGILGLENEMLI